MAGHYTTYRARVTLEAERTSEIKYVFSDHVSVKVNGNSVADAQMIHNQDGTLTVWYELPVTAKRKIVSITAPEKKGTILTDTKTKAKYQVISSDNNNPTVAFKNSTDKKAKTVKIPKTVTIKGITYQVVSVSNNACKNHKKVTKIIVGSNVKKIGKYAFSDYRSKEQTEKLYKIVPKERSE